MLLFVALLIIISVLILIWLGSLAVELGLVLGLAATALLLYQISTTLLRRRKISLALSKLRAKWACPVRHVGGLALFPGHEITMAVSRQDELIFYAVDFSENIALNSVSSIFAVKRAQFSKLSDKQLLHYVDVSEKVLFSSLRTQISKGFAFAGRSLLFVTYTNKAVNHPGNSGNENKELLLLEWLDGDNSLKRFLRRPEIRSKYRVIDRK